MTRDRFDATPDRSTPKAERPFHGFVTWSESKGPGYALVSPRFESLVELRDWVQLQRDHHGREPGFTARMFKRDKAGNDDDLMTRVEFDSSVARREVLAIQQRLAEGFRSEPGA